MQCLVLFSVILQVVAKDQTAPFEKNADDKLKEIEHEFWAWRMRDVPEFASSVGEPSYNDILESFDISVYAQRKVKVSEFLNELQNVDKSNLPLSRALDFDILTDHLTAFLEGARFEMYQSVNPVNFLEGITANPGILQFYLPFSTVGDFENYLQRLTLLPTQINEKIELMKIAISLNHTLNNVSLVDTLVSVTDTEWPLYVPAFTLMLNGSSVSEQRRASLRSGAIHAVASIKQALRGLKTFLELEYMPACRAAWGVRGLRNGTLLYQQCLRYHTSTDVTPQEVYNIGLEEIKRIQTNMQAALKRLGFNGTSQEFYNTIRGNPHFYKNTSEELLATYEDYVYNRVAP